MLSAVLDLHNIKLNEISVFNDTYIDKGFIKTSNKEVCFIAEKDIKQTSLSKSYYGQSITEYEYEKIKEQIKNWSLQSLIIESSLNENKLEISRNHRAECGIFLSLKDNKLYIHWDPTELYQHLDKKNSIDITATLAQLELIARYKYQTVFKNILTLPERGKALISGNNIEIIKPEIIEKPKAIPLKENADPVKMFHALIEESINSYYLEQNKTGVILSSGLDTTIVSHFINKRISPEQLHSFGYWMLGKQRDGVKEMRQETVQKLNAIDYYPAAENNIDTQQLNKKQKLWIDDNILYSLEQNLAKKALSYGIDCLSTGIGGDELCTLLPEELAKLNKKTRGDQWNGDPYEGFTLVSDKYKNSIPTEEDLYWPQGYVGISSPGMANGIGLDFMRCGVWLIHPLSMADMHIFSYYLPYEWRDKRLLSREALRRLGWSEYFVMQNPKEDLTDTMIHAMLQTNLEGEFKDSPLVDMGLIDKQKLDYGIKTFRENKSVAIGMKIATALKVERGLKSFINS